MKLFRSKKGLAIGLAAALTVGVAGGAFAFFTSTGAGTGTATVGTATDWAVTTDAATGAALTPQPASCLPGPCAVSQTVAYHVKNNNSGQQNLANVEIKIAHADGSTWDDVSGCSASDFSINGLAAGTTSNDTSLAGNIAAGATVDGSITVVLIDNGSNQDSCKLASVPLYLSAT